MFAGFRKLDNLVVIVDNNGLQIDGSIEDVCSPYPIDKKFEAFNFHVINVADGNDFDQLEAAFKEARETKGMPTAIIMKTVKGKGVPSWKMKPDGTEKLRMMQNMKSLWQIWKRQVKHYVRSKEDRNQRKLWKCISRIRKEIRQPGSSGRGPGRCNQDRYLPESISGTSH